MLKYLHIIMVYIVEISVNIFKHNNVIALRKMLEQIAKKCKLYSTYHKIENNELQIEGNFNFELSKKYSFFLLLNSLIILVIS